MWLHSATRRAISTKASRKLHQQLQEAAIVLLQVPNQGRGLFPTRAIRADHTIFTEDPLAAVASTTAGPACDRCTRPFDLVQHPAPPFCTTACAAAADEEYAIIQQACDWQPLQAFCVEQGGWRFPLLAARILCRAATEAMARPAAAPTPVLDRVMLLCHANVPHPPPEWHTAHALVVDALRQGAGAHAADLASWDTFLSILSRCHINAFRLQQPALLSIAMHSGIEAAAHAAVQGDGGGGGQGSALYCMASFFNHSCCPNVHVTHPDGSARAAFVAARDIAPYEHLTISYIDQEAPVAQRQQQLHWGYGFTCDCPVCKEEAATQ